MYIIQKKNKKNHGSKLLPSIGTNRKFRWGRFFKVTYHSIFGISDHMHVASSSYVIVSHCFSRLQKSTEIFILSTRSSFLTGRVTRYIRYQTTETSLRFSHLLPVRRLSVRLPLFTSRARQRELFGHLALLVAQRYRAQTQTEVRVRIK